MADPMVDEVKGFSVWLEIWTLAGERWPPKSVPTAWRVYECLKNALINAGVSKAQTIAFADDFFHSDEGWGDLTYVDNHKRALDALNAAPLDAELVALKEG